MPSFNSAHFREKVRDILKQYTKEYKAVGEELINSIENKIKHGASVSRAVSSALAETAFFNVNKDSIVNAIYLAACAGYGVLPEILTDQSEQLIKGKLLSTYWNADKMPLSKRLHQVNSNMRELIIDTISSSMHAADNVNKMALKLYDGYNSGKGVLAKAEIPEYLKKIESLSKLAAYGDKFALEKILCAVNEAKKQIDSNDSKALKAAYRNLVDNAGKFKINAIEKAVRLAIEEKTRYYGERIARTESARAWFDGYLAENQDNDDVWGYRWVLSSRHHLVGFDQCDVIANMDVGFGPGIYPKNKVPSIPRHPHCMCMTEVVFSWEVKNIDRKINPNKARKYINGLSEYQKKILFGSDGAKKYQKGEDWQKLLYGWDGFGTPKVRLDKSIFNLKDETKNVNIEEIKKCDFSSISHLKYSLNDIQVRTWYIWHDINIPNLLDKNLGIEDVARKACELRNMYRTQARDLMANQKKRKRLDRDNPNRSFEELIELKMKKKNMTRIEAIQDIYLTATKTNKEVNKRLGLE